MRWTAFAIACLVAGCAQLPLHTTSSWSWQQEDSMLPDFQGEGPSFPVLAVHMHAEWSQRMQEEFEKNPWVCSIGGDPLPLFGPGGIQDAAPCFGPAADLGTGRIFVDEEMFASWDAEAIAVIGTACEGGILPIEDGFRFGAVEHEFLITWEEDHFLVDGHRLDQGKVLKATYWYAKGDEMDQRFVRVSFDFPGYWLRSNVGPGQYPYDEPETPERAGFRDERVLALEMPAHVSTLGDALYPLAEAMEGDDLRIANASLVVADGRLTELVVDLRTDREAIRWYMASRVGDVLRVLGNATAMGPGQPMSVAMDRFEQRSLDAYPLAGAMPVATRFVFSPTSGFDAAAGGLLPLDLHGPCDGCAYLYQESLLGQGFRYAPDAVAVEADHAPTWRVSHHQADGSEVRGYYQAALKAS